MKMSKAKKRTICGFLGVALACTVFLSDTINNVTDVQATTKVLDGITEKYSKDTKPVKILEIVPTDDEYEATFGRYKNVINKSAELGYFMPFSNAENVADYDSEIEGVGTLPVSIGFTSRGGVHGDPNTLSTRVDPDGTEPSEAYRDMLIKYRQYGLVMASGMDRGWFTKIGDYPIYANNAVFSTSQTEATPNVLPDTMVKGIYTLLPGGTGGNYEIDITKYYINENHEICIRVETPAPTVSNNGVSGNDVVPAPPTVSYNAVTDIDPDAVQLPTSTDGLRQYITKAKDGDGTGNVSFEEATEETIGQTYYGYSDVTIFYEADKTYHRNSDWFSEYVLGSNKKYKDVDMEYIVKSAGEVSVDDITNADLVYISGTAELYKNNDSDISNEVMLALYNQEINYTHKAIIMDHALYEEGSTSNINKLAILLWQESADALISAYGTTTNPAGEKDKLFVQSGTGETLVNEIPVANYNMLTELNVFEQLQDSMLLNIGNGNFVTGNVYVYNHHKADFAEPKAMVDALDNFANGDFNSSYTSDVVAQGFPAVINYINASNKNSMTGSMSTDITPAVVIQYILVSDGQELTMMKNDLRVLEIQPVPGYLYNPGRGSVEYLDLVEQDDAADIIENRKAFVSDYLSTYYADKIEYISFESMTVYEFNGRNEDLVENYDIIYIGDEVTRRNGADLYYYREKPEQQDLMVEAYVWNDDPDAYGYLAPAEDKKVKIPNYVDDALDGSIYYNIGDEMNVFTSKGNNRNNLYGYLDYQQFNNPPEGQTQTTKVRFNGRDITKNKLAKMKEFLDAQGLMIVAEDLLGSRTTEGATIINPTAYGTMNEGGQKDIHGRVDTSTNLYELLNYGLGKRFNPDSGAYDDNAGDAKYVKYDNMVAASDIKQGFVDKSSLNKFVSAERMSLVLMEKPTEYAYTSTDAGVITSVTYLNTRDTNGTRYLNYKFSIAAEMTADGSAGVSYTPHLYIDLNNDGKYSKTTEDVTDCTVTIDGSGEEAAKDANTGDYLLYKDVVYNLRRNLTDDYAGILKWKLDIQSNLSDSSHASEEGYTLVKNETGFAREIHILQITDNGGGSNLDLENQLEQQIAGNNTQWGPYLVNIPDYELHIRTMTIEQFEDDFDAAYNGVNKTVEAFAVQDYFPTFLVEEAGEDNHTRDLPGVNMLVCGFGDDFDSFDSYNAVSAVKAFVEAGNPVLMAHDFVSYGAAVQQNRALRQLVGMDLYGVSQNISVEDVAGVTATMLVNRWGADGNVIEPGEDNNLSGLLHRNSQETPLDPSKVILTRSANGNDVRLIESTGKEVVYEPNTGREGVLAYTQGYSNFVIEWQKKYEDSPNTWINDYYNGEYAVNKTQSGNRNTVKKHHNANENDFAEYTVEKLNDGQITEYPYRIPQSFKVAETHSQWYSLDLTSDADNDGESDVVVWYVLSDTGKNPNTHNMGQRQGDLGGNPYSDKYGGSIDPANGYFIYNKGNVTYTGAGHENMDNTSVEEKQLFVNTLLAAFQVGKTAPEVKFYESTDLTDQPIKSVVVPYDENVTAVSGVDSSVLKELGADGEYQYKYKFVDPNTQEGVPKSDGTEVFFRVNDSNFARGTKTIDVKYYLKVNIPQNEDGDEDNDVPVPANYTINDGTVLPVRNITVDNVPVSVVDISSKIYTYKTSGASITDNMTDRAADGTSTGLESGDAYGIYLPMNYLNDSASFTIYVEAQTKISSVSTAGVRQESVTEKGYQKLTITKADLLDLE